MNLGTENKKQMGILAIVGALAIGAAVYLYSELYTPSPPTPAAPVAVTTSSPPATRGSATTGRKLATPPGAAAGASRSNAAVAEAQLDPTLHMEGMLVAESLVYTGNGRNIFFAGSAPAIAIPKIITSVRTSGPIVPPSSFTPSGPAPPTPIDLKFFGTETASGGDRKGFLLHGEDVFFVSPGDIVQRRYRVVSIAARSIVMEDIANSNRQTLPLIGN